MKTDEQWNNAQSIFKYCWVVGSWYFDRWYYYFARKLSLFLFVFIFFVKIFFWFFPHFISKKVFCLSIYCSLHMPWLHCCTWKVRIRSKQLLLIAKWLIFPFSSLWRKKWPNEKKNTSFYWYPLWTMLLYTPFASLKCININIVFSSWFIFFVSRSNLNYNFKFKYSLWWPRVSISDILFIFFFISFAMLELRGLSVHLKCLVLCSVFSEFKIKFLTEESIFTIASFTINSKL